MQRERDGAVLAVVLAIAFSTGQHIIDAFAVEGNEAEAVRDELIGKDGSIGFDFDEVDGHSGDFGENGAAQELAKARSTLLRSNSTRFEETFKKALSDEIRTVIWGILPLAR